MTIKSPYSPLAEAERHTIIKRLRAIRSALHESQKTLCYALDQAEASCIPATLLALRELADGLQASADEVRALSILDL